MATSPSWLVLALAIVAGCRAPAPALYGPGLFTTSAWDFFLASSPDQKRVLFGRADEVEPWIAPDESYLIFSALRRGDGKGGYDLYLSRRIGDRWGKAEPLPAGINTSDSDWNQSVSPDGTWLYFSSNRPAPGGNGKGDIYRVPMAALGL
jgi:hypothetical protein